VIRARHVRMGALYLAHRFQEVTPYEVQALLINACNLKCRYCRYPEIRTQVLSTEQWKSTLRELGELGTLRLKFQGGEPTLRHDFVELCAASRRAGIVTAVVTNGIRVAEAPSLLAELDELIVSLDSVTPAIHDGIRGEGSHARAVAAIQAGRARGLPVYVIMALHRESAHELEAMLDFCEALGVGLHAQPLVLGREFYDERSRPLQLDEEKNRAVHRQLVRLKRQGRNLMFSARAYERVAEWPDYDVLTTQSEGDSNCVAGRYYVHIEPNGDIWPCGLHGADFKPQNVVEHGLVEALRHVRRHNCADCYMAYLNERKAAFSFRPHAVWEVVKRG